MRNYKQYNRYEKESKGFAIAALIVLVVVLVYFILLTCGMFDEPLWKPDVEYPLINARVDWLQNNYGEVI